MPTLRVVVLVSLIVAGCVPPVAADRSTQRATRPLASELEPFTFDSADLARAGQIPAFAESPLVTWGRLPSGRAQGERVRTFDLRHQATSIRVDWDRHALVGTTTVTVAPLGGDTPLATVALDAVGMTIGGVTDAGGRVLRHTYDGRSLVVTLPALVRAGTTAFTVSYETERPKKGFYFIDRARRFWTQGETEDTRYWVPTYDYPNDKTTWEFKITVPRGEEVLSNGRHAGTRDVPEGTEWHWILDRPASTYLMSAAGGEYEILRDKHGNVPVNYWTYPDSIEPAWRGFGKTPRMIDIFERRIGVPYPWAKYDQIVAPDYIFGGMENVTATTQNDNAILWPKSAEPQKNSDGLVSHELAHQWFGDLLTMRDWSHIWLNEGFATFMETIYFEDAGEPERAALERRGNIAAALIADRRARRPLVFNRWENDPLELFFTGHIYPKGAAVLDIVRHQLGDSLFWRAINDYTTRHAFGSVVSDDLRAAFERASGRDFGPLFAKWVYGAGFPVYRVSYRYDEAARRLTLDAEEIQPRDSLTGYFDPDVDVEVLTDGGAVRGVVPVRNGRGTVALELPAAPRSIRWDKGDWLPDVADFPRPTAMLAYQLLHDDDVTGRYEALDALARRPSDRYALAALVRALRADRYWGTRARAAAVLGNPGFGADPLLRGALLEASSDEDPRVREAATAASRRFAAPTERD